MSLSGATLEEETANLRAIAAELANRDDLVTWATHNADISDHVGALHRLYPWLTPGVTLALGTARYTPDDPFVKQVADTLLAAGRRGQVGLAPGSAETGFLGNPLGQQNVAHAGDQFLGTHIDTTTGGSSVVGHVFHDVASTLGSEIPDVVRSSVKTAVRTTFAGLQTGLEGVGAAVRTDVGVLRGAQGHAFSEGDDHASLIGRLRGDQIGTDISAPIAPQLTLVQMINGKNAGTGFFPAGDAHDAAVAAQNRAANIGGHALTVGRGIGGLVFPANTRAYGLVSGLADATVALYADPANIALGEAGELRKASSLAGGGRAVAATGTDWGRFDRARQTLGIRTAAEQLDSAAGQGVIAKLRDLRDFRSVHHFLGGKVDAQISAALAAANTPDEVRAILDHELGTGIERLPAFHPKLQGLTAGPLDEFGNAMDRGLGNLGYAVGRVTRNWRPLALLPAGEIPTDLSQPWARNEAVRQTEAMLVNAHVPDAEISPIMERMATARDRNDIYAAFNDGTAIMADTLVRKYKLPPAKARELTRAFSTGRDVEDAQQYFRTSLTDKYVVPGTMVDGEPHFFDGPHMPDEHLNSAIPMPNVRDIRAAASAHRRVLDAIPGAVEGAHAATTILDAGMHLWKAAQLIRPALFFRIMGEAQLATAAAGDVSAFRHPLDWIAYVTGRKGGADIIGDLFDPSDYNAVWKGGSHAMTGFDPQRVYASQWTHFLRGDRGFNDAWAQEIRHMHLDELGRETARAMREGDVGLDTLKNQFYSGDLRHIRMNLIEPGSNSWRGEIYRRDVSDAYIDTVVTRIRNLTRDDGELLDAIGHGGFRDERLATLRDGKQVVPARLKYDRAPQSLRDRLAEMDTVEDRAPDLVKGYLYGQTKLRAGAQVSAWRDRAVDHAFNFLVGERMQTLAASPVFRQEYYKEIEKLIPHMDPEEAARAAAAADKAGIHGLKVGRAAGALNARDANLIAKSRALDSMSALLHDLGHRGQAADMLRFVAPFGDAWKKVMTRWVKLLAERPANVERFRQGINQAYQSGFAHPDPQTGEMVFTIPFTAGLDQATTGLPFPQTAPLNGLSIVGSGLPGVGPAVSVPLSLLAPHIPHGEQILNTLVPYGAPNTRQGVLEAFLPGWVNRLRTAGVLGPIGPSQDEQSVFNHSVDQVMRYLVSDGADISTPEGIAKTFTEARNKARLLYMVRGALQATSPSPPSVEYMVRDKSGRLTATYQLTNELQNLYNGKGVDGKSENDPDKAVQIFLKLHGKSNYLSLQSFSTPRRYGLPTTKSSADWLAKHPEFKRQYANVYGLLTPQTGAFDYGTYLEQIHSGERQDRTPEQFLELANARIAAMIYDTQRDALPDDASAADKTQYLGQLRSWLKVHYPGYQAQELNVEKAAIPDAINELTAASDDRLVRKSDAAIATREYLQMRQQVIDFERQNGSGVSSNRLSGSAEFGAQSQWLASQASRLITQYPTFFPVWDMLLSHEVTTFTPPTDEGI